jgi:hypothetical protein
LWALAHLAVLEIRFFGAVVVVFVASIIVSLLRFTAAKIHNFREISAERPQIFKYPFVSVCQRTIISVCSDALRRICPPARLAF